MVETIGIGEGSIQYSSLMVQGVDQDEENWMEKYKSVFTYANYNDVDRMGYVAPKRYPKQDGPRYKHFTYRVEQWNERNEYEKPSIYTVAVEMIFLGFSYFMFIITLPISLMFSLKFIGEFERLVVLRLGRAQKLRGPGATLILPCIDNCTKVDLRVTAFNVPPLQIITVDRGLIELGATVFLQVKDAIAAVCAVRERNHSTRNLAVTVLHRITCKRQINEITSASGRREIAEKLQSELSELTISWGTEVLRVELSDVKVIKEGENMAFNVFNKIIKSELGNQMIGTLAKTAEDFVSEQQKEKEYEQENGIKETNPTNNDLIKFSEVSEEKGKSDHVDLDELINNTSLILDESLVAIVGCTYQIKCDDLGEFYINLKQGSGWCCKGTINSADVVFNLDSKTLLNIFKQKITPLQAYLNGTLKVNGSLKTAVKFTAVVDRFKNLI